MRDGAHGGEPVVTPSRTNDEFCEAVPADRPIAKKFRYDPNGRFLVRSLAMATTLNWIHLTDIHFGMEGQGCLWAKLKHDFFKDILKLSETVGPWDVVLFTGDLTQKGRECEFDAVAKELEELWKVLSGSGDGPVLCAVPGNHDLVRPDPSSTVAATLRHWWQDEEIRREFWKNRACELRTWVESAFLNYSKWVEKLQVPQLAGVRAGLPGDFNALLFRFAEITEVGGGLLHT